MKYCLSALSLFFICSSSFSQVSRYSDINHIGWLALNGEIALSSKVGISMDCQFRRDEWVLKSQQYLYRAGCNYRLSPKASVLLGYAFIETYPYGNMDYPISPSKVNFPEHRTYQQLVVKDQLGAVELTHRYRLEQRWVASQLQEYSHHIDEWRRTNRFRYLLRFQLPFKGTALGEKAWYFAGYNELFVSFGSKVRHNLFDQNRSSLMLGYKFSKRFRIEAGPFSQIVQFGSLRNVPGLAPDKTIVQYNLGYIINAYFNFDLGKKTE